MSITPSTATGDRVAFAIALSNPGAPVPDGDGGSITPAIPIGPGLVCGSVTPIIRGHDYEHPEAGTTIGHAESIVMLPFVAGISAATRLAWTDRAGVRHEANVMTVRDCPDHAFTLELHVIEVAG